MIFLPRSSRYFFATDGTDFMDFSSYKFAHPICSSHWDEMWVKKHDTYQLVPVGRKSDF